MSFSSSRRRILQSLAAAPILLGLGALGVPPGTFRANAQDAPGRPFEPHHVRTRAREMARKPYEAPPTRLPAGFEQLSYDQYRDIRFDRARNLFPGERIPFQAQVLPRGFLFKERVDIHLVTGGVARPLAPDNGMFQFGPSVTPPKAGETLGYSGLRLMSEINKPGLFDEIAVFQGASYFRALGRGNVYGTSARGLALNTADARGEEFPLFREFWIEAPGPEARLVIVHALLDSPSATGAFRFLIRPGDPTSTHVEMAIYPRNDLEQVGIGPLTSMFLFAPNDAAGFDDFRPAVHDAEGLEILLDSGERLWRPLSNPKRLEVSVFADRNVKGFGLMQRQRAFFDYQDMEAEYHRRPSVWVEPLGEWGEGSVFLVEIPAQEEIHDNVVAFWRPKTPLRKGGEYLYQYRTHWGMDRPGPPAGIRVAGTRVGGSRDARLFVIEFVGEGVAGVAAENFQAQVTSGAGRLANVVLQRNPHLNGLRLSFNLHPEGATSIELRARLKRGESGPDLAETWLYRWTAS